MSGVLVFFLCACGALLFVVSLSGNLVTDCVSIPPTLFNVTSSQSQLYEVCSAHIHIVSWIIH